MKIKAHTIGFLILTLANTFNFLSAQIYTSKTPDGTQAATFDHGCIKSHYYHFSFKLPADMSLMDLTDTPYAQPDPTGKLYVIFQSDRRDGKNSDVLDVAAQYADTLAVANAESWMKSLHAMNDTRKDVPSQGEIEPVTLSGQQFYRLHYQQKRDDGIIIYEVVYAYGIRNNVVFFIFGSADSVTLQTMEKSMQTFSLNDESCINNQ